MRSLGKPLDPLPPVYFPVLGADSGCAGVGCTKNRGSASGNTAFIYAPLPFLALPLAQAGASVVGREFLPP